MVRRDYQYLAHFFKRQLSSKDNDKENTLKIILNFCVSTYETQSNFNPIIFWNKATGLPIPSTFPELFPNLDFEKTYGQETI